MFRNRKVLRTTAVCLLLNTAANLFLPTVSYALTSGPSQPEFTAYESPGSTDMVNLATGDFTYNIPLMEVPSPEGSFSIPLAYKAGIALDQQSSWVGLGWNINPGAISRSVVQFPDDANGELFLTRNIDPGQRGWNANILGIVQLGWNSETGRQGSVDLLGLASVNWSKGKIKGGDVVGIGISDGKVGINPIRMASAAVTIASMGATAAASAAPLAAIGKEIGQSALISAGTSTAFSAVGMGSSTSMGMGKPTYVEDRKLFHTDYRVFVNENFTQQMYGSLYFHNTATQSDAKVEGYGPNIYNYTPGPYTPVARKAKSFRNSYSGGSTGNYSWDVASDMHVHLSRNEKYDSQISRPISIAHDYFSVMGEGVSGSIRPYRLETGTLAMAKRMDERHYRYNVVPFENYKVNFRYDGSPTNAYDYHKGQDPEGEYKVGVFGEDWNNLNLSITDKTLWNPAERTEGDRKGLTNKHLTMGKHVNWFTNREIEQGGPVTQGLLLDFKAPESYVENESRVVGYKPNAGDPDGGDPQPIIEDTPVTYPNKFRYQTKSPNGIGAFVVTAEDGTTYHYALPVYNTSQLSKVFDRDNPSAASTQSMQSRFATSWLLTAVTGSDYVDRAPLGLVGPEDWGYWVQFEYGKFASNYHWRAPYAGYNYDSNDPERKSPSFSSGSKETYYLNRVRTRTHTALFIKNVREDGRGRYSTTDSQAPSSSLRLEELILLNNQDYNNLATENGIGAGVPAFSDNTAQNATVKDGELRNGDTFREVLDVHDVNAHSAIRNFINEKNLKRVVFNYTYDLCQGTYNSFSLINGVDLPILTDDESNPIALHNTNSANRRGKLTLKSVAVYGPQNVKLMPDFKFDYNENNPTYNKYNSDAWGYYKGSALLSAVKGAASTNDQDGYAWSLSKIITPLGGTTHITYERDTYGRVADFPTDTHSFDNLYSNVITLTGYQNDLRKVFQKDGYANLEGSVANYYVCNNDAIEPIEGETAGLGGSYRIIDLTANSLTLEGLPTPPAPTTSPATGCSYAYRKIQGVVVVPGNTKGSDIRVAMIETLDGEGNTNRIGYKYTEFSGGSSSSGVISKLPSSLDTDYRTKYLEQLFDYPNTPVLYGKVTVLNGLLHNENDFLQKTEFSFVTPSVSMVKNVGTVQPQPEVENPALPSLELPNPDFPYGTIKLISKSSLNLSNNYLEVNTSRIGQVNSIKKYNKLNVLQQSTAFNYSDQIPNTTPYRQGIFTEGAMAADLFQVADLSKETNSRYAWLYTYKVNRTTKKYIPSVLISTTTTDGGLKSTNTNQQFDFYTGQVLQTEYKDALGVTFQSVTVPAYEQYPNMGPKMENPTNKHMLSQTAASYLYKVENGNRIPVAASAQTWNDGWTYRNWLATVYENSTVPAEPKERIWRKHESWTWDGRALNPDGTLNGFVPFDFTKNNLDSRWLKMGEVTQYNRNSMALESRDMNGNYAASKLGYNSSYTIASAANARYTEIAYSGAEDKTAVGGNLYHFGGEVRDAEKQNATYKHTGNFSIRLDANQNGFTYQALAGGAQSGTTQVETDRTYRVSAWIHQSDLATKGGRLYASLDGVIFKEVSLAEPGALQAGDWYLVNMYFELPASVANGKTLTVGCRNAGTAPVYVDDFRFHPVDAPMNAYVYNPRTGQVTYVLDNDNLYTRYEYDAAGILIKTYRERLGTTKTDQLVSEQRYGYGRND